MSSTPNTSYPYQVWGATLLVTPVLILLISAIINRGPLSFDPTILFFGIFYLGFSFLLAVPSLLLHLLVFRWLVTTALKTVAMKTLLVLIGTGSLCGTFYLIDDRLPDAALEELSLPIAYGVVFACAGLLFPIRYPAALPSDENLY